ncbi:Phosphoglycolate phosphatase [Corynebacterium atrinae]|uniref:HAD-IA family hydrolase n=1 Tax=Corynebacterium atrinae TaxID=1336740 RepID=UPI0025B45393|nr:HAD-IA family hydrolase [Corynebacterium atrinae]WJY62708.1 Phosphoglycolate phosphatase [Corynebacterium atrinae]
MRGLIVDYVGVLDGAEEDQKRWRDLFAAAKANGVATAILSNDPGGPGAEHIREWEFRGIVDAVLLSGEIGAEKPEEAAFAAAAAAIDLPMNDCVLVDDSILNVRGAVEAGLVGVLYQVFDRAVIEICSIFDIEGEF